jgi:hypothetical protein
MLRKTMILKRQEASAVISKISKSIFQRDMGLEITPVFTALIGKTDNS